MRSKVHETMEQHFSSFERDRKMHRSRDEQMLYLFLVATHI
jgi:hypothetical protein